METDSGRLDDAGLLTSQPCCSTRRTNTWPLDRTSHLTT
jgi:hypothetical protein